MYTQEENRSTRLAREKDVYRYTTALETGDIDTIAILWHKAQHDATLEEMLLETQSFYMNEGLRARAIDADIAAEVLETVLPTPVAVQEETLNGNRHHGDKRHRPARRASRVGRFVQGLAAVLVVGLILGGFLVLFSTRHTATVGINTTSTKPVKWHIVPSLNGPQAFSSLFDTAALTASDVWTVGANSDQSLDGSNQMPEGTQALIEHWNGSRWQIVPSPRIGTQGNLLNGVVAISASNVWAVGNYVNSSNSNKNYTLIEHWNGTQWNIVASPNPGPNNDILGAVAAVSPDDIWAVGTFTDKNTRQHALIEHWNGSQWQVVPSPNPALEYAILNNITAISSNNIWVIGATSNSTFSKVQTLIEHWNGSQWQVVPSPNSGQAYNVLWGVTVVSADNIWAVGNAAEVPSSLTKTLIEHWNGTQWDIVSSPNPGKIGDILIGVVAITANNIWAVGWAAPEPNSTTWQPLVEHWNGKQWSIVASPPSGTGSHIAAITAPPATRQLWVVGGDAHNSNSEQSLTAIETF